MPIIDHTGRIIERLAQLATCLDQAAHLTDEIIDDITMSLESTRPSCRSFGAAAKFPPPAGQDSGGFSIIDRATFTVHWGGKSCYLGNTLPFKFLERLARRPNQLIPCDQLLDDVWQGLRSREAMRSVVKVLRQKLSQAGMEDLAKAIDGTTAGHYGLMFKGRL
jgi:DNA-binding response OmpR family regulator